MPSWINDGFKEYAQRLPKLCELQLVEIAARKRGKNADTARILRDEARDLEVTSEMDIDASKQLSAVRQAILAKSKAA